MHVGVDVGGTKVLAAEVAEDGAVLRTRQRSTRGEHGTAVELEDAMTGAVTEVAAGRTVEAVGIAVAGLVDSTSDLVRYCTHLPWREDAVRPRLAERWGWPVVMENDASCAAVAEHALGAAAGATSFLMVTVGTGIGGAFVHEGRLVRGVGGMAGEFGHMRVVPEGLACQCGLRGCWEQYCSGTALPRLVAHARPDLTDGPAVTGAAQTGDEAACAAFAEIGEWLGTGLAGLVAALDPALVVVGGGVSAVGDLLLDPARDALGRSLYAAAWRRMPPLVTAALGPSSGAIGAAHLARSAR